MMDEESRKKLEEMAEIHKKDFNRAYDWLAYESFLKGAQAAWDLAVEYERERIKKLFCSSRDGSRMWDLVGANEECR